MKTRMNNEWNIMPSSAPLYLHRCSKCKKQMPFYCSNKFRINAQKRTVDVWLIYKCTKCDSTFNIDILSRVNPKSIDSEEYTNFQCNDETTAWKYAFNPDVINMNKVITDYSQIEYEMTGDLMSLEEIKDQAEELIEFEIKFDFNLDLDLAYIIRKNLNISLSQLEEMLSAGVISIYPPGPVRKAKVKYGQKVIVSRAKLEKYMNKDEEK